MVASVSLAPAIVAMNTDGGPVVFTWITVQNKIGINIGHLFRFLAFDPEGEQ